MTSIDAFILIGGKSSRMGMPKHKIEIGGSTMLNLAIERTHDALPHSTIRLVSEHDKQADETDYEIVCDLHQNRGAWSGVHTALTNSTCEWTFVIACDYPMMSASVIRTLAIYTDGKVDAVVPLQTDGRPQPLCAFYRSEVCLKIVNEVLERDETPPLRVIFDKVRTRTVAFEYFAVDKDVFLNVNSPEDLEKARRLFETSELVVAE